MVYQLPGGQQAYVLQPVAELPVANAAFQSEKDTK